MTIQQFARYADPKDALINLVSIRHSRGIHADSPAPQEMPMGVGWAGYAGKSARARAKARAKASATKPKVPAARSLKPQQRFRATATGVGYGNMLSGGSTRAGSILQNRGGQQKATKVKTWMQGPLKPSGRRQMILKGVAS